MRFDELNESNYMLFAIKFYDNPQAVTKDDFESDLKRIRYIKRLLKRYKNTGELKIHLIMNILSSCSMSLMKLQYHCCFTTWKENSGQSSRVF